VNDTTLAKLCCPLCKGGLSLRSFQGDDLRAAQAEGITHGSAACRATRDGVLLCAACKAWYPVSSYIPVMLTFETPFHRYFMQQHAEQLCSLAEYAAYRIPYGQPRPGERSIQDTFTDEWDTVQGNELSFGYTMDDLRALYEQVQLKWLASPGIEITSVLSVGCGLGREAIVLQDVTECKELFAVDLNFALLKSGEPNKERTNLHFVIASLYSLPFKAGIFDLVYSQGVLHHTFSPSAAFKAIADYVRHGGHLFVWVYGLDDHLVVPGIPGVMMRVQRTMESVVRPVITRSPRKIRDAFFTAGAALLHPVYKAWVTRKPSWRLKNTNHSLRDRFSPRYAHRHSYNEVLEWFENVGFEIVDVQSPRAYKRLFGKQLRGVGITGLKK